MWQITGNTNGNEDYFNYTNGALTNISMSNLMILKWCQENTNLRAGRPNDPTGTSEGALLRRSKPQAVVAQTKGRAVCQING